MQVIQCNCENPDRGHFLATTTLTGRFRQETFNILSTLSILFWSTCWLCRLSRKRLSRRGKTASAPPSAQNSSRLALRRLDSGRGSVPRHGKATTASPGASGQLVSSRTKRVCWTHQEEWGSWYSDSEEEKTGDKMWLWANCTNSLLGACKGHPLMNFLVTVFNQWFGEAS